MPASDTLSYEIEVRLLGKLLHPPRVVTQDSNAVFRWERDGLKIRTVDGANTIKIHQEVQPSNFESYDTESDGFPIGVKCDRLNNIIQSLEPSETVSLEVDLPTNELNIYFSQGQYEMAGVNIGSIREANVLQLSHEVDLKIHKQAFDQAYQIIGMASEEINIEVSREKLRFFGKGDTDDAEISFSIVTNQSDLQENEVSQNNLTSDSVKSKYDKRLVNDLKKFIPDQHVVMKMAESQAMEIISERSNNRIDTEIVVAPMVTP